MTNRKNQTDDLSDEIGEMFSEFSSDDSSDPSLNKVRQAFAISDSETKKPTGYVVWFGKSKRVAKLTRKEVSEIKKALIGGLAERQLAFKYAITQSTIHQIKTGATWKTIRPFTPEQIHNNKFYSDGSPKVI